MAAPKKYQRNPQEIDAGLIACILEGENWKRAAERMTAAGMNAPAEHTLKAWTEKYADRYQELRLEWAPKLAEKLAGEAESLAVVYAEMERRTLERMANELPNIHPRELSGMVRNLATSKALQVDKISSPLRGRPTSISEVRNPQDAVAQLAKALGMEHVIEGTAEEMSQNEIEAPKSPDPA